MDWTDDLKQNINHIEKDEVHLAGYFYANRITGLDCRYISRRHFENGVDDIAGLFHKDITFDQITSKESFVFHSEICYSLTTGEIIKSRVCEKGNVYKDYSEEDLEWARFMLKNGGK